jgi:hypothetical protein
MAPVAHWFATFVLLHSSWVGVDDPVFSGPQAGERIAPFKVLQFAGPRAGEEFDLFAGDRTAPTVLIFVHEATRPGMQLMRPLDLYGAKLANEGLVTHFVWLTPDRSKTEDWLRVARGSLNLKSPISISLDGIEGPGSYGLNRKVTLTILVAKEGKVVSNFAIIQPNETDAPRILGEIAKLVGKTPPTTDEMRAELGVGMRRDMARPAATAQKPGPARELSKLADDPAALVRQIEEKIAQMDSAVTSTATGVQETLRLEAQIARLQARDQEHHSRALARVAELENLVAALVDALNESRATIAKLEGKPAPKPLEKPNLSQRTRNEAPKQTAQDLPGRTPTDPEIIALMRRLIQPTNDEATVKEIVAEMMQWVGNSDQRKDDLAQFAKRIAHLGYGSDAAKDAVKRLAGP